MHFKAAGATRNPTSSRQGSLGVTVVTPVLIG
jgi:hypothetical protein